MNTVRFLFSLLVLVASPATAQDLPDHPMLRIETGMHSAMINRIAVDKAERLLATASKDKTVRLWDLASGELRRTLRLPSDEGDVGKAYAVALSPDGRTVAVGGFTDVDRGVDFAIYLYDTATGALAARLGGLPNVIHHLTYSPDGRYLAACLGDGGLRLYRTDGGPERTRLAFEDTDYGDESYWADWTGPAKESTERGWRLATTCFDGLVRLYDVPPTPDDPAPPAARPLLPRRQVAAPHGKMPFNCAFRPDGEALALGYNDTTRVSVLKARDLTLAHEPDTAGIDNGDISSVAWSRDGVRLLAAGSYYDRASSYPVVVWEEGGRGARSTWPGSPQTVMQLLALGQGRTVLGASDPLWAILDANGKRLLHPDDPQTPLERRARQADFAGAWEGRFHLSADGALLEFGTEYGGKNPATFSLRDCRLTVPGATPGDDLHPPRTEADGLEVDWDRTLSPTRNGRPLELKANEISRSLAITPDGRRFVLGTDYRLLAYTRDGDLLWNQPVPEVAWSVNVSADGRFVVAAYADGTIRWHRMSDGATLLSLFLNRHKDDTGWEWVCWSPEGYYQSSANGENLIGWQVNRGLDQNPDFFSAGQLKNVFQDNTGILARVIETATPAGDVVVSFVKDGKMQKPPTLAEALHGVPTVEIADAAKLDNTVVKTPSLKVTVTARPTAKDVAVNGTSLLLTVNGKAPADTYAQVPRQNADGSWTRTWEIPLAPGRNELVAVARSATDVEAFPARMVVRYKGDARETGNLWILAVGLELYEKPGYNLDYCLSDLDDTIAALVKRSEGLFLPPKIQKLVNEQATRDNVLTALRDLAVPGKVQPGDAFMLLYAGHGAVPDESEDFSLVLHGVTQMTGLGSNLAAEGLAFKELEELLKNIDAQQQVVILDACHSGAAKLKVRSFSLEELALRHLQEGTGTWILASSGADQVSRSHESLKNGIFSHVLAEGIRDGKAAGGDPFITVHDLNRYTQTWVPALSQQLTGIRQYPFFDGPPNQDFVLGRVVGAEGK